MTTRFTTLVPPGTPVRVYWNLHSRCWSVQTKTRQPGTRRHIWRVAGHADILTLTNVTFRVYERGRQRVISTGVKNVHAYALGTFQEAKLPDGGLWDVNPLLSITYNPARFGYFHTRGSDQRVDGADVLYLNSAGGSASLYAHYRSS